MLLALIDTRTNCCLYCELHVAVFVLVLIVVVVDFGKLVVGCNSTRVLLYAFVVCHCGHDIKSLFEQTCSVYFSLVYCTGIG